MKMHLNFRSKKRKDKIYKSYSLASSYRDNKGVPRKNILLKLGSLTDEEANRWRIRLQVIGADNPEEFCLFSSIEIVESKYYLNVAVISAIYDMLGLNNIFIDHSSSPQKDIRTDHVAKILTISRCLDPQANYKTVEWFNNSYLPQIMKLDNPDKYNKNKIFRELANIHERKKLLEKQFLLHSRKNTAEGDGELFFFDGTTSYFEGSHCPLGVPGQDKTNGYQDSTILICLLTDKSGLPITWDVSKGDKRDVSEFKAIGHRLAGELHISNVTFCFDRGIASASNFELIEDLLESKYISGLDRDQIENVIDLANFANNTRKILLEDHCSSSTKDREKRRIISVEGFYQVSSTRYCKDLGVHKKYSNRRHIISFDINIFQRDQDKREANIHLLFEKVEELNIDLSEAKRSRDEEATAEQVRKIISKTRLQGLVDYKIVPISKQIKNDYIQTFRVDVSVDEVAKREAAFSDGLLVYITNHTESAGGMFNLTANQIARHYRDKYVIENAFRFLKSFLDLRPMYVWLKEHVEAHIDICMIGYFISKYIELQIEELNISIREFYSMLNQYASTTTISSEKEGRGMQTKLLQKIPKKLNDAIVRLGIGNITAKSYLENLGLKI